MIMSGTYVPRQQLGSAQTRIRSESLEGSLPPADQPHASRSVFDPPEAMNPLGSRLSERIRAWANPRQRASFVRIAFHPVANPFPLGHSLFSQSSVAVQVSDSQ